MTKRAFALVLLGGAAILAATYALPPEQPILPKLSREECRQLAADFLGVAVEELDQGGHAVLWETPRDTRPPSYAFRLPYKDAEQGVRPEVRQFGRALVGVDGLMGTVTSAIYEGRRYEIGRQELGQAEGKAAAEIYLQKHWQYWAKARFLSATEAVRPSGVFQPATAPQQSFAWVVEENGIRTGHADVTMNLSTGEVIDYGQYYYSAQGLPPARLTKERPIREAFARVDKQARESTKLQDAFLATRWHKGEIGLVWVVWLETPSQGWTPPGVRPRMHTSGVMLDAYTGKVLWEDRPR